MTRFQRLFIAVLFIAGMAFNLNASPVAAQADHYTAYWKLFRLEPGNESGYEGLLAALILTPEEGWYTYAHVPGAFGQPTTLNVRLMPGEKDMPVLYTEGVPKKDPFDPTQTVNVYEGATPIFVPLGEAASRQFSLKASIKMLLCSDKNCLPVESEFMFLGAGVKTENLASARSQAWWPMFLDASRISAQMASRAKAVKTARDRAASASQTGTALSTDRIGDTEDYKAPSEWAFQPKYFRPSLEVGTLVPAILFGLLAGFLLNFMPCVLPVVTLKLSAVLTAAGMSRDQAGSMSRSPSQTLFREHNLFFALGILSYFLGLSGLLAVTGLAWGQIFQDAATVTVLTAVVFALSLSLFGFYNLPIVDLKTTTSTNPRIQAFFTGFLATLLATPCSGPFLGGVLGWALMQPPHVLSAVFMSIGLGMAFPYIVMTYLPGMVRFFPKPGAWTVHLERVVGFFLLGTCIYLMSILPETALISCLVLLWFTALGAWLWGMAGPGNSTTGRFLLRTGATLVIAAGVYIAFLPPSGNKGWEEFDPAGFTARLGHERMLLDFTADWCPTCKVLEKTVLTEDNLEKWQEEYGLTYIKVDMTGPNPPALKLLKILGSRSLPVVAVFNKGANYDRPLVIRDLFTEKQLEEALETLEP